MKISTSISITKASGRDEGSYMRLTLRDNASRLIFATVEMTMEQFAHAITGLGHQEVPCEVRGLEFVGLRKVTEKRSAAYPEGLPSHDRSSQEQWLIKNKQEEGWFLNSYLGSQGSVTGSPATLHYGVYRYERPEASTTEAGG